MENGGYGQSESKEKTIAIYSDFMMRIAQFDELVSMGCRLLVSFQQALEVHTCHLGLQDYISKAKVVVNELENLLGNAAFVVQTSKENDKEDSNSVLSITSRVQTAEEKDEEDISCNSDSCSITSIDQERPDVADYASMMAIIYSMVKQDYTMQVRIVSSLNHKSSQEELDTYCQMWSLRPFVDDETMSKAWNLVPGR